jgi:hypothetical protein
LFIDYSKEINSIEKAKVDNKLFQELRDYCQIHGEKEIDQQRLGINSNNNFSSLDPNKNNHQLIIALTIGASMVLIMTGVLVYLVRKRNKK